MSSEEVASSLRSSDISETLREDDFPSLGYSTSGAPSLTSFNQPFGTLGTSSPNIHANGHNTSPIGNGPSNGVLGLSNGTLVNRTASPMSATSHSRDSSLSSSLELSRAGSRRPLCVSDEQDAISAARDRVNQEAMQVHLL